MRVSIAIVGILIGSLGCGGSVAGGGSTTGPSPVGSSSPTTGGGPPPGSASDGPGVGAPTPEAGTCRPVLASDYDQSCTEDSDCVPVGQVAACPAAACDGCALEAINVVAAPAYKAAFSAAVAGSPPDGFCGCPCSTGFAICRQGTCQAAFCGAPRADTLPACSGAGGTCTYTASFVCAQPGPPGSCAYADETCCL